jgi:hypothetical protein
MDSAPTDDEPGGDDLNHEFHEWNFAETILDR